MIETNVTISWFLVISQSVCKRRGYDTFPKVAIISLLHLTTPIQRLRQGSSTQKFYIINVVSIFINRNWPSILFQDPTCINAPTLRFKWKKSYAIVTTILLHVSMHVLPIFSVGNRSTVRKIFLNGANLVSGSKFMWPGWEHVVVIHYIISLSYIIHVHFYLFN